MSTAVLGSRSRRVRAGLAGLVREVTRSLRGQDLPLYAAGRHLRDRSPTRPRALTLRLDAGATAG